MLARMLAKLMRAYGWSHADLMATPWVHAQCFYRQIDALMADELIDLLSAIHGQPEKTLEMFDQRTGRKRGTPTREGLDEWLLNPLLAQNIHKL